MLRNEITDLSPMTDDEPPDQLHHALRQKENYGTPISGPPMAGYAHGRHTAHKLGGGSHLLEGHITFKQRK